jgi:HSP20 family protein
MNDLRVRDLFPIEPVEDMFRSLMRPWRADLLERAPQIRLDVTENDTSYLIKAEVPGVRKEDVEVRIDGSNVTISADIKKEVRETDGNRVLREERQQGHASRVFSLDSEVDDAKSTAKYHDGILELTLLKKPSAATKRLQIA